jgi:hypothetical protein
VRALFPPKVISDIESETGCKITMNEKFLFVSAKEPSLFSKGIDHVHDMIQAAKEKSTNGIPCDRSPSTSPRGRVSSPRGRVSSPRGRMPSPRGRDRSPSRRGLSPVRKGSSPRGRGSSPRSRDRSPKGWASSPRSRNRSPKGRIVSPRRSYSPRREISDSQRLRCARNERPKSYDGRSFGDRAREDSSRVARESPHGRSLFLSLSPIAVQLPG